MQRRRVVVQGHVQGVFFRETTRRRAQAAGVSGWARNLPDGTVEALCDHLIEALRPPAGMPHDDIAVIALERRA